MAGTTTIGIPYPVAADNNDVATNIQNLVNWLDPVIEGSYTQTEINALSGAALWTNRRLFNSTRECFQWYNGSAWLDEQAIVFNAQTGTSYVLVLADANSKIVTLSNSLAISCQIPVDASVAFPVGTSIGLIQLGTGQVTVSAVTPGTTTLRSPSGTKLRAQYSRATLIKLAANEWLLDGDVVV